MIPSRIVRQEYSARRRHDHEASPWPGQPLHRLHRYSRLERPDIAVRSRMVVAATSGRRGRGWRCGRRRAIIAVAWAEDRATVGTDLSADPGTASLPRQGADTLPPAGQRERRERSQSGKPTWPHPAITRSIKLLTFSPYNVVPGVSDEGDTPGQLLVLVEFVGWKELLLHLV